jgi:uncharacterized membrane protein YbaN (DUF454 family)
MTEPARAAANSKLADQAPGADADTTARPQLQHALAEIARRPRWQRVLWVLAGALALATGIVGIFVPLLPTTPFVLLAAFCFSRGSTRCERWLVTHPRFGPLVRDWRATRAVPLRAKQLASVMMALGSAVAAYKLPLAWAWVPAACCVAVAAWLWRLPTRRAATSAPGEQQPF